VEFHEGYSDPYSRRHGNSTLISQQLHAFTVKIRIGVAVGQLTKRWKCAAGVGIALES